MLKNRPLEWVIGYCASQCTDAPNFIFAIKQGGIKLSHSSTGLESMNDLSWKSKTIFYKRGIYEVKLTIWAWFFLLICVFNASTMYVNVVKKSKSQAFSILLLCLFKNFPAVHSLLAWLPLGGRTRDLDFLQLCLVTKVTGASRGPSGQVLSHLAFEGGW